MEWKNKIKLSFLLALVSNPLGNAYARVEHFGGFTIGAGGGAILSMADLETTSSTRTETDSSKNEIFKFGPMGVLSVGYGHIYNRFFMGADLGLNFLGARKLTISDSTETHVPLLATNIVGIPGGIETGSYNNSLFTETEITRNLIEPFLDMKFGFLLAPTILAYLKGGISYNSRDISTTSYFNASGNTEGSFIVAPTNVSTVTTRLRFANDDNRLGVRAGIGGEFFITPHIGLATDYVFTFYHHIDQSSSGTVSDVICDSIEGCVVADGSFSNTSSAKVRDQKVTAQIIYHIGG